jgi:predicted dehydrogenase
MQQIFYNARVAQGLVAHIPICLEYQLLADEKCAPNILMINVGIIGTGLIAREHARAISMIGDKVRVMAATDLDAERLQHFCTSFQVARRFLNTADLIAHPEVDLVAIATPPNAHEELTIAALESNKYVFCEKPLAHSLASAVRVAQVAARHPGRLTVSYQLRYDPSFRRLLWLCRNGWIGTIQSATIERHSYIPHASEGSGGWWGSWGVAGGGVLATQLIHELDLLLLVMGRPTAVTATMGTLYTRIESEDFVEATIRFENEGTARCVASVNSGRVGGGFTIRGSDGAVSLPWKVVIRDSKRNAKAVAALDKALPDARLQAASWINRGARFIKRQLGVAGKSALTPHALLYQEIVNSIENGDPLPVPPSEAINSLELCVAAYESALTGKEVDLPLSSTSLVYCGVSKEAYVARERSSRKTERKGIRIAGSGQGESTVRVGLVGLDTSHASAFAGILNDPNNPLHIPGAKVVAAYPGGSADMPISISRVAGFTAELRDIYGARIVDTPEDVAEASDVVCILAADGRAHPALLRAVVGCDRPIFVDKPFAVSSVEAQSMFALAAETGVRIFTSSAFRYAEGLIEALNLVRAAGEQVRTCSVRYWLQIQQTQGRYFWYGIHASEILLAVMGKGVREVEVLCEGDRDTIKVLHEDGRTSFLIGTQNDGTFHVNIETDNRILEVDLGPSIPALAARVLAAGLDVLTEGRFPRLWRATEAGCLSGNRPGRALDPDQQETLEVIGLLDAAQRSHSSNERVVLERAALSLSMGSSNFDR